MSIIKLSKFLTMKQAYIFKKIFLVTQLFITCIFPSPLSFISCICIYFFKAIFATLSNNLEKTITIENIMCVSHLALLCYMSVVSRKFAHFFIFYLETLFLSGFNLIFLLQQLISLQKKWVVWFSIVFLHLINNYLFEHTSIFSSLAL